MKPRTDLRVAILGLMLALMALTQIGGLVTVLSPESTAHTSQSIAALQGENYDDPLPLPTPTPTPTGGASTDSSEGEGGGG